MPGHRQCPGMGRLRAMTRRFRFTAPDDDTWCWFEVGDDGCALRQIVFHGDEPTATAASDTGELTQVRRLGGELGRELYEVVYGTPVPGSVPEPPGALPVTELEFSLA